MFKGLGGLGDMAKMMKQAKEMQGKVSEVQDGLSKILVNGESGAGLVKVTMTAKGDITNLDIDPSIFSPTEKEVVEDLIIAALTDAKKKSLDRTQKEMAKITNELGLPENFKLPF
ncbi:MAG: YbaB/EbfC family nucleoid-associated protein [Paracoccaceae bacterium]|mgnify:FL=1